MSLEYILKRVARSIGVTDLSATSNERRWLVDLVNVAAEEVWEDRDLPGSLRECYINVTSNKILAFPPYIGELRAVRDYNWDRPWELNDLRPRYHHYPWKSFYDNLRHIGEAPVIFEPTNVAPLTLKIQEADPTLTVTIVGSTATASRKNDVITMDDVEKVGTISFTAHTAILLNKFANNDLEIYDADGNLVSYILNNSMSAKFLIYDMSDYPTSVGTAFTLEALYKMALNRMEENYHTFPIADFDNVIVLKCEQLWAEKQKGQEERAILAHTKGKELVDNKVLHKVGTLKSNISFKPNPFLNVFDT